MKSETFDFLSNLSTLWAMVLGAVLATVGGFATSQLEWHIEKHRRQRQAALLFGEVLSTLRILLDIAHDTHGRGDPFGPITLRMLRSARSEIDIYTRNREILYDIHDAGLRTRIHTLIIRVTAPLDGIFDTTEELQSVEAQLRKLDISPEHRAELEARRERLGHNRNAGYEYMMEVAQQIAPVVQGLEPIAGHPIGDTADAERAAAN